MIEPVATVPASLAAALVLGWALAFAFLGLWLGERGRRIDAQKREERLPVIETKAARPATVRSAQTATPELEGLQAARASYIDQAKRAGFDALEAAADFDAMMEAHQSDVRTG